MPTSIYCSAPPGIDHTSKDGGDMTGGGLRLTSYAANALNQYNSIIRSGFKNDFVGTSGISDVITLTVNLATGQLHFPAYNGNGNIMALLRAETGAAATVDAAYEYDPFGRTVRATGPTALSNPFRFSTKFTDEETGLVYYGYRYYDPMLGRWVNRDPIEERGGRNLYRMCTNNIVCMTDFLGREVNNHFIPIDSQKIISDGKGFHHINCCFWKDAQGNRNKPGDRMGWIRWYQEAFQIDGLPYEVGAYMAKSMIEGLGLTDQYSYGGNLEHKVTLKRTSETEYIYLLEWNVFFPEDKEGWLKKRLPFTTAQKCESWSPRSASGSVEIITPNSDWPKLDLPPRFPAPRQKQISTKSGLL
jgi:RHS repeat-associated protein